MQGRAHAGSSVRQRLEDALFRLKNEMDMMQIQWAHAPFALPLEEGINTLLRARISAVSRLFDKFLDIVIQPTATFGIQPGSSDTALTTSPNFGLLAARTGIIGTCLNQDNLLKNYKTFLLGFVHLYEVGTCSSKKLPLNLENLFAYGPAHELNIWHLIAQRA